MDTLEVLCIGGPHHKSHQKVELTFTGVIKSKAVSVEEGENTHVYFVHDTPVGLVLLYEGLDYSSLLSHYLADIVPMLLRSPGV